MQIIITIL